jgi:hypothetical protein
LATQTRALDQLWSHPKICCQAIVWARTQSLCCGEQLGWLIGQAAALCSTAEAPWIGAEALGQGPQGFTAVALSELFPPRLLLSRVGLLHLCFLSSDLEFRASVFGGAAEAVAEELWMLRSYSIELTVPIA